MLRLALLTALLWIMLAAPGIADAGADIGPQPVSASDCVSVSTATPTGASPPDSAATSIAPPLANVEEIDERDLPPGDDADPETVAALFALERQYAACLNVGDLRALAPLFDPSLQEIIAEVFPQIENPQATPDVPEGAWQIEAVALRCVRTYPGGYAVALLEWFADDRVNETNARVYRDTGAGWLVFDELTVYVGQGEGCDTG